MGGQLPRRRDAPLCDPCRLQRWRPLDLPGLHSLTSSLHILKVYAAFPGKDVPVRKKPPPSRKSEAIATHVNGHGIHGTQGTRRCPPVTIPLFHLTCFTCALRNAGQPPWGWKGARQEMDGAGVRGFRGSSGVGWKGRELSLQSLAPKFPEEPLRTPPTLPTESPQPQSG